MAAGGAQEGQTAADAMFRLLPANSGGQPLPLAAGAAAMPLLHRRCTGARQHLSSRGVPVSLLLSGRLLQLLRSLV